MNEDIKFWHGVPVAEMDADELRYALAEVYRQLEWAQWEAASAKAKLAKLTKGKKEVIEDAEDEEQEALAA